MKRRINIFAALMVSVAMAVIAPMPTHAQDAAKPLMMMDFNIVGVSLSVGPGYQAVPKGIASQVTTGFVSGGQADYTIEGLKEGTHKIDFKVNAVL